MTSRSDTRLDAAYKEGYADGWQMGFRCWQLTSTKLLLKKAYVKEARKKKK